MLSLSPHVGGKSVTRNTVSFWLRSVVSEVYKMASDRDHTAVKAKVHDIRNIGTSRLFIRRTLIQ